MVIIFSWIIGAFIVGVIGSNRSIGFFGAFMLSILLSPLIGLIVALVSTSNSTKEFQEEVIYLQKQQVTRTSNSDTTMIELGRLQILFDTKQITKEEYDTKKLNILSPITTNSESFTTNQLTWDEQKKEDNKNMLTGGVVLVIMVFLIGAWINSCS